MKESELIIELIEALEEYDKFSKANDDWRDGDEPPVDFVVKARQVIAKAKDNKRAFCDDCGSTQVSYAKIH